MVQREVVALAADGQVVPFIFSLLSIDRGIYRMSHAHVTLSSMLHSSNLLTVTKPGLDALFKI